MAQFAIAWCLKNPNVSSVITGASRPKQITENMKAIEISEKLDTNVMERVDEVLGNKPQPDED
jgi:aryl-alcohol dehydrogenase-like predicted oxidoreductase